MEITLTGYNSNLPRYLIISKPFSFSNVTGTIKIYGHFRKQNDSFFISDNQGMLVKESLEEINKLIEITKFNAQFEDKLK